MMLAFRDTDVYAVPQKLNYLAKKSVALINVCIVIGKTDFNEGKNNAKK